MFYYSVFFDAHPNLKSVFEVPESASKNTLKKKIKFFRTLLNSTITIIFIIENNISISMIILHDCEMLICFTKPL